MPKVTDNTVLKYAKAIKEYCNEHTKCENCVFADEVDEWNWCPFTTEANPCKWEFKE